MMNLRTKSGRISPNDIILIQLDEKIPNEPRILELSPRNQERIFKWLRQTWPLPVTFQWVLDKLKTELELNSAYQGRPIKIEKGELDLALLLDYI